jgi:threonyl-tRNA synthetase
MPELILEKNKRIALDLTLNLTGADLAKAHLKGSRVYAVKVDGVLRDLSREIPKDAKSVELITEKDPEALEVLRHGTAHVLAQAVKSLEPNTQVTIGPVIENGFFYDFSRSEPFKEEDLAVLEKKMAQFIKAAYPVKREEWPVEKAIEFFQKQGEVYKVEIIKDLIRDEGAKVVSIYSQGDFKDLCRGPHIPHTGMIPAFKLTHVAGAYWRGDEKNEMLTRVYGTAFFSKEDLDAYLKMLEEAKKRDHRRIGVEQKLFSFHPEAPASPFFHPAGAFIYAQIQDYLRTLNRSYGFNEVISPLVMSQELWQRSGHYDNYRENMYFTKVDERDFAVKPMNCPGHCLIYGNHRHSYRDLPVRYAEFGRVHRHERSGVTAGLFRVRSFVQDDAHVFCTAEQVEGEIIRILEMIRKVYKAFDFEFNVELSTRPEKRIGSEEVWDRAEKALEAALTKAGLSFKLNPGDGAFYGPKIDFHLKDSIGRTHQCGTVQLDFSMPVRFELEYTGSDNRTHHPVMIHRALIGSFERFLGIYIEHVAGKFPLWLAPKQIQILCIADEAKAFCERLYNELKTADYRVHLDDSVDKLSAKIKKYQPEKAPYMLIVGAREAEQGVVSIRDRDGQQRQGISVSSLKEELAEQMKIAHI